MHNNFRRASLSELCTYFDTCHITCQFTSNFPQLLHFALASLTRLPGYSHCSAITQEFPITEFDAFSTIASGVPFRINNGQNIFQYHLVCTFSNWLFNHNSNITQRTGGHFTQQVLFVQIRLNSTEQIFFTGSPPSPSMLGSCSWSSGPPGLAATLTHFDSNNSCTRPVLAAPPITSTVSPISGADPAEGGVLEQFMHHAELGDLRQGTRTKYHKMVFSGKFHPTQPPAQPFLYWPWSRTSPPRPRTALIEPITSKASVLSVSSPAERTQLD